MGIKPELVRPAAAGTCCSLLQGIPREQHKVGSVRHPGADLPHEATLGGKIRHAETGFLQVPRRKIVVTTYALLAARQYSRSVYEGDVLQADVQMPSCKVMLTLNRPVRSRRMSDGSTRACTSSVVHNSAASHYEHADSDASESSAAWKLPRKSVPNLERP